MIEGFISAVSSKQAFDPGTFLNHYASNQFGLSSSQAMEFTRIFRRKRQHLARQAVVESAALGSRDDFHLMNEFPVEKNRSEWDHLLLMAHMEAHQLEFMLLEDKFENESFQLSGKSELKEALALLSKEADAIDVEFRRLNGEYLDPHELQVEIEYRRYRLDDLIAKINR